MVGRRCTGVVVERGEVRVDLNNLPDMPSAMSFGMVERPRSVTSLLSSFCVHYPSPPTQSEAGSKLCLLPRSSILS